MTDLTPQPPGQFREQREALETIARGMSLLATELGRSHPDEALRVSFRVASADIERRRAEAQRALAEPSNFEDYTAAFDAHGLTSGTTEWTLKVTGLNRASDLWTASVPETSEVAWEDTFQNPDGGAPPPPNPEDLIKADDGGRIRIPGKKSLARLFTKWANIILGSMGFVPGAGALEELKKALEAGLDEV